MEWVEWLGGMGGVRKSQRSGGDVGAGLARIKLDTSTNRGSSFSGVGRLGDGSAAQDAPRMVVDDARLWLGWLDYRGAPALYSNRTEQ